MWVDLVWLPFEIFKEALNYEMMNQSWKCIKSYMCKLRKVRAIWRTSKEHKTSQHTDARGESWHDAAANVTWRWSWWLCWSWWWRWSSPWFQNTDNHKRNQYDLEITWTCYSLLPEGLSKVVSPSGIFSPFNLKAARLMWHPCLHDSFSSISSHPETNTARVHFPRYWSETRQRPMLQDQT